jgi:hypothetical protein
MNSFSLHKRIPVFEIFQLLPFSSPIPISIPSSSSLPPRHCSTAVKDFLHRFHISSCNRVSGCLVCSSLSRRSPLAFSFNSMIRTASSSRISSSRPKIGWKQKHRKDPGNLKETTGIDTNRAKVIARELPSLARVFLVPWPSPHMGTRTESSPRGTPNPALRIRHHHILDEL